MGLSFGLSICLMAIWINLQMADLYKYTYHIEESIDFPCFQPADWDDREYIDDPNAVKPEV